MNGLCVDTKLESLELLNVEKGKKKKVQNVWNVILCLPSKSKAPQFDASLILNSSDIGYVCKLLADPYALCGGQKKMSEPKHLCCVVHRDVWMKATEKNVHHVLAAILGLTPKLWLKCTICTISILCTVCTNPCGRYFRSGNNSKCGIFVKREHNICSEMFLELSHHCPQLVEMRSSCE